MESPEAIVHSQSDVGRGKEAADCRGPPAVERCHPVGDATTTSSGQPLMEDRGLVELLEVQKRMFERT
jgi:hypothetical protein